MSRSEAIVPARSSDNVAALRAEAAADRRLPPARPAPSSMSPMAVAVRSSARTISARCRSMDASSGMARSSRTAHAAASRMPTRP